ncbi:type III pantothenate kinase [Alistipes sp.]|uniref:type III pantothenate kinase n=1 Tax=Alistipes sp. TaxID=1872444 RepID=UPI003AEFA36A
MNLIVDIGNTLVKLALFDGGRPVAERSVERLLPAVLDDLLAGRRAEGAIVASTRGEADEVVEMLRTRARRVVEFTSQTPVPIANAYLTPETLGRDRLAAAVGVAALYPGRNVLIVDFGTAVTIDLVTADNTFRGGCISPGLGMRLRALHDYTARLPLCAPTEKEELTGLTTEEAVRHGVMNSLTFEIEGYIDRMRGRIDDLCVIFTGGDAKFFVKRIKNTIFACCNPVFCGLDRILAYNAREEHLD